MSTSILPVRRVRWVVVLLLVSQVASFTTSNKVHVSGKTSIARSLSDKENVQDTEAQPIDKFRNLMGSLYGVAGLAHAADCYLGPSTLLVASGSPPYPDLPAEGQALVALWCAAGPIALVASRLGALAADAGLLFYGAVEVFGAAQISTSLATSGGGGSVDVDALMNAVLVQGIVFASWLYSQAKEA